MPVSQRGNDYGFWGHLIVGQWGQGQKRMGLQNTTLPLLILSLGTFYSLATKVSPSTLVN